MSRKGTGENSMAVSWLGCEKFLSRSGWAISLVLSPNGPAAAEQKLLLLIAVQLYL